MKDGYPMPQCDSHKYHSSEAFYQDIAKKIATMKRTVVAVMGDAKSLGFAYTIGNQEKNLPELLILGSFNPRDQQSILNLLSDLMLVRKVAFPDNSDVILKAGGRPVRIYDASVVAKVQYTLQATQFYGDDGYKVQQVLLPDPFGNLPPNRKVRKPFRVPVLRPVNVLTAAIKAAKDTEAK